ncbi:MAG: hypothetical protein MZW92_10585 [Comamonadaceae bacterium]|nr:hypothetical protein [Comamonadaceae bacterium]
MRGRSYKILADVEITDPNCSGVIFAHGSRFGGHTLFIKDKKLLLRVQLPRHQAGAGVRLRPCSSPASTRSAWSSSGRVPASTTSRIGQDEALRQRQGRRRRADEDPGRASSRSPATVCASATTAATPSARTTRRPAKFKGGTILGVGVTTEKAQYLDLEKLVAWERSARD